jgi:ABC-2 type transport system permease protein
LAIGLVTMGMMFVAIGLFFSALTRNQIVAAIWTFVVLFLLVVLTRLLYIFAGGQQASWVEAVRVLAVFMQIQSFGQGQLDVRTIALHLSMCAFALYVTVKLLEIGRRR